MTGLDLMRKFPENMARPMLKKARKDLTNTYGEYFIDYTYDINSQQPVRFCLIPYKFYMQHIICYNLGSIASLIFFRPREKLHLQASEKVLDSLQDQWKSVFLPV